ncbi:GNAT family N-acetyltransferase [Mangrovicella endophytica]|uniref:GNAT family N-acetyltransferase n=1 Tax=Mangrovicella endophytica TaxID=2066697 RepID=UPI000C9DBF1A|nr:GNAT family N-acetyltransferase [Mangrovicella endophytica]
MSAVVRPATEVDIAGVVDLLHTHMNPKIPPERWRRILDYPWRPEGVERGWLVEADGRIVGFMATIYSDRLTPSGWRRFCDLGSWYLLREHRGSGVGDALLQAGMAQPDVTYATMTARAATGRKIRALGFGILDDSRLLFRPRAGERGALQVETDPDRIAPHLDAWHQAILAHHRAFNLRHALLRTQDGHGCYLVYQVKLKGEAVAYHEILHASDRSILALHAQAVADVLVEGETGVLAIDSRFLAEAGALADNGQVETIRLPRWYRSPDVAPADIDHLFSETVLLDLKLP